MLDERGRAAAWGIAHTSFPLDRDAAEGTWLATWQSGSALDEITFDVRPFRLPRLTVDATTAKRWHAVGDRVVVQGRATYTSGAPVRNASVTVELRPDTGRWPMPLAWEGAKPTRTSGDGTFQVSFGSVPGDLMDRTTLHARVVVTDETGEASGGATRVVLSHESLQLSGVTEFGDGLLGDLNNRLYLRVTTPDGRPVTGAEVVVDNPLSAMDTESKSAQTDANGVLAIQLDPGDPVTVVEPAPPFRPRPFLPDPAKLVNASEPRTGDGLGLQDRRNLDRRTAAVAACGRYALGNTKVEVALQVNAKGEVERVLGPQDLLGRCVISAMRRAKFDGSNPRILKLTWLVPDSRQPWLKLDHTTAWGPLVASGVLEQAALRARQCLRRGQGTAGARPLVVSWFVDKGATALELNLKRLPNGGLSASTLTCVARMFRDLELDEPSPKTALGESVLTVMIPQRPDHRVPQATTRTAYQLRATASRGGEQIGTGTIIMPEGTIPAVRLRATPSLAAPGEQVTVEVFRGPQFHLDLPEELVLRSGTVALAKAPVSGNKAQFVVPDNADGFLYVDWQGARTVLFVQRPDPLSVTVSTNATVYRPGANAELTVRTVAGATPRPAAVGLVGVDQALAQLAPLLGPDDYGRITVRAEADSPAFNEFDPRALALGQVKGENAAKAALLRISQLPMDEMGDEAIRASAQHVLNTNEITLGEFYRLLEATVRQVRAWEANAPADELLTPERMVSLVEAASRALREAGAAPLDAFGRPLTLAVVPPDLLGQLDPRQVVADATRLPEDVVSFERYVNEEVAK